jgi:2'-hydroxyisoflavone reductase
VQLIDARDLAEWTIRVAEQRATGVFNAMGPASAITMREMLAAIAQGIAVDAKLIWAPAEVLRANNVAAWSDMPVWIPGQGKSFGFHRRDFSRAIAEGLTFRPLPVTAADTLAWFRTLPAERQGKLRAGLTAEREAVLLTKLRAEAAK